MSRSADSDPMVLPASIELAWGIRPRPTRGPKPGLDLQQIVAAAMGIALADGLDAVSMARVAAELSTSTMSLYRYVAAKAELLTLMVDAALGDAPRASRTPGDWRARLACWARAERQAYQRHPWVLRVPIDAPPLGPNNVAWLDDALACLAGTPLSEHQKLSCVLLISGHVRQQTTLMADFAAASQGHDVMPGYAAMLSRLIDGTRFPALHRAIASGALGEDDDLDVEFGFGLERILDGIASLIADRAGAAR